MSENDEYVQLAEKYTDTSAPLPAGGASRFGADAAAAGRAFMIEQYGSAEALDAELRKAGRPVTGQVAAGPSPTIRCRISEADYAALQRLGASTGKNQSELMREAVQLLLAQ